MHLAPLIPLAALAWASSATPAGDERGNVRWFEGSYAESLRSAEERDTLVALEFWADWCGWCKEQERTALRDPAVVAALEGFVCLDMDVSSDAGGEIRDETAAELMNRFQVRRFPTFVFVSADGEPQDLISGFLPTVALLDELARIRNERDTVADYRRRMREHPDDLELRYRLACKLDALGDVRGYETHLAAIAEADPEGVSLPRRRMTLGIVREQLWGCMRDPELEVDPTPLLAFLADETHASLLSEAWLLLGAVHEELGDGAGSRAAYRAAWEHVQEDQLAPVGNGVAWGFWEQRDELTRAEKRFALRVARRAVEAIGDARGDGVLLAQYLDTLACCAYMNGKRREALALAERCRELAPQQEEFRTRYEQFKARQ